METKNCSKCGSDEMMVDVKAFDYIENGLRVLTITEPKDPGAIFQILDRSMAKITADVCGKCGNIEWKATNAAEMYRFWQKGYR